MLSVQSRSGGDRATGFLPANSDADAWAASFVADMLDGALSSGDFERAVAAFMARGRAKLSAPLTAQAAMRRIERARKVDGHYAADRPELNFRSQWLVGSHGAPGAIYIDAPAESSPAPRAPDRLNRPLHLHDSGRMALILHGSATFLAGAPGDGEARGLARTEVGPGDLLFWPAWTAHSFDAHEGFGLLSGMAAYVSPEEDGFSLPLNSGEAR